MSYENEKYYDDPFERGEVDWSKYDDEGYYAKKIPIPDENKDFEKFIAKL